MSRVIDLANKFEQQAKIEERNSKPKKSESVNPKNKLERALSTKIESYHNCAVQLYKCDGGRYYLDKEAMLNVFSKVEDKLVAIYSIAGKYRSGKSFMLANFLKYLKFGERENWVDIKTTESFKYKNCEERVTTGIWIWPEPIIRKNEDGREVAIFLMDTQGWHDEKTESKDNALVFALSAVLSSVMIFNAEKRIGEDDLQYFQCFTSTARLIDPTNKDEPFQKLIFLLRDWQAPRQFSYGYYDHRTLIKGKNFKQEILDPRPDQSIEASSVREIIQSNYTDISAYLMPYPGNWIYNDDFSSQTADPIFVNHLKDFITGLFTTNTIVAKTIGDQLVTGSDLITYAEFWAEEFNYIPKGLTGALSRMFSSTDETHYLLAYQTSLDYFDEKIRKILLVCQEIDELLNLKKGLSELNEQCLSIFHAGRRLNKDITKKRYEDKLKSDLNERNALYTNIIEKKVILRQIQNEGKAKNEMLANIRGQMSESSLQSEIESDVKNMMEKERINRKVVEEKLDALRDKRRQNSKNWFGGFVGNVEKFFGRTKHTY